jgi:hypothetical protein
MFHEGDDGSLPSAGAGPSTGSLGIGFASLLEILQSLGFHIQGDSIPIVW